MEVVKQIRQRLYGAEMIRKKKVWRILEKYSLEKSIIVWTSVCILNIPGFTQEKFDIVFLADPSVVCDTDWLSRMKTDWHATAINLRIRWYDVEDANHRLHWQIVDRALQILDSARLGVYIRESMSIINHEWYPEFIADDFHQRFDGTFYRTPYPISSDTSHGRMLNYRSPVARSRQIAFFKSVVAHLNGSKFASRIRLIVPVISPDDESEYPFHTVVVRDDGKTDVTMMSGYSRPEIHAFARFLENKYETVQKLNTAWASTFSSIPQVRNEMKFFGWHQLSNDPEVAFRFPVGRQDWIDFRATELKKFLDTLRDVSYKVAKRFPFGLQFGCFYDNIIQFRGFYDPTPLLEKADMFITDEPAEYFPNFGFAANYSRTIARFWNWKNRQTLKRQVTFAVETNWPGYGSDPQHHKGYTPEALSRIWAAQLRTFYQKGASALFISHWGTTDLAVPNHITDSIKSGAYMGSDQYLVWSRTLARFAIPVLQVEHPNAIHVGCRQALVVGEGDNRHLYSFGDKIGVDTGRVDFYKGYKELPFYRFPFRNFSLSGTEFSIDSSESYDVVTDYMIEASPEFARKQYKRIFLTPSSVYATRKASEFLENTPAPGFPRVLRYVEPLKK